MPGNLMTILPAVVLGGGALLVYVLSRMVRLSNRGEALLTVLVLMVALLFLLWNFSQMSSLVGKLDTSTGLPAAGGIRYHPTAVGLFIMVLGTMLSILIAIYSGGSMEEDPRYLLFYPLLLLMLAGLLGVFMSQDLFNLFLLTELVTVAGAALIAFRFHQEIAIKAGFKYLLMSSLGTMVMLLGIYYVYRSVGHLGLTTMLASPDRFTQIGAACFLVGFSLKAGVVPLHTWVPDGYGHAPSAVSALLAGVVSKSMLFILPVICLRLGLARVELGVFLMIFGCGNMLLGSVRMLNQELVRRFLSFSSIAQTGYLMFGLGIGFYYDLAEAFSAGLFLLLVIGLMKSLAFLSAGIYEDATASQALDRMTGAGRRMRWNALAFSIALGSLAGIPLLAGFTGKWLIFSAALQAGDLFASLCLAVFLISTVIGLAGYLPLLVRQYLPAEDPASWAGSFEQASAWRLGPVLLLAALVMAIGLYPAPWLDLVAYVVQWMAFV